MYAIYYYNNSNISDVIDEENAANSLPSVKNKDFQASLGAVINNAKDWGGRRLFRNPRIGPD